MQNPKLLCGVVPDAEVSGLEGGAEEKWRENAAAGGWVSAEFVERVVGVVSPESYSGLR